MAISRRQFTAGALAGLAVYLPGRLEALRPRPKLFVFLIAEQFRQLYLDRGGSLLVPGGFRELMTKGVYYPDCRLAASGFTASGLATLATGAYPSLHGIVADQWYDRKTHLLTKARAEMLEATTLADEVERTGYREEAARSPQNRIFWLGLNEGPTSLLAGHSRGQVYWMDAQGQFNKRGNAPEWLFLGGLRPPTHKKKGKRHQRTRSTLFPYTTLFRSGHSRGQVYWMDAQGQFNKRGNAPEWLAEYDRAHPIEELHEKRWLAAGAEGSDLPPLRTLTY